MKCGNVALYAYKRVRTPNKPFKDHLQGITQTVHQNWNRLRILFPNNERNYVLYPIDRVTVTIHKCVPCVDTRYISGMVVQCGITEYLQMLRMKGRSLETYHRKDTRDVMCFCLRYRI